MDSQGYAKRFHPPLEKNVGGTQGLNFIFLLLQYPTTLIPAVCLVPGMVLGQLCGLSIIQIIATAVAIPIIAVVAFSGSLVVLSRQYDSKNLVDGAHWKDFIEVHDAAAAKQFENEKIPMATFIQLYMREKADFKKGVDPVTVLFEHRWKIFRFILTLDHLVFFSSKFVGQLVHHSQQADTAEVRDVYERGNDFYGWFLGDRMVYTSGVFENEAETLEQAQDRKLDIVCRKMHLQPGEELLDIGCGWGTLLCHSAKYYGVKSTGVTLAREQRDYLHGTNAKQYGVEGKVDIMCMDYRDIPTDKKYDKISCLEMAEHVGIKNFQTFLLQVKDLLKDDGVFYLQIAGLRRAWQFEDLIWGIFMGTYIFPAADASCPLGFVVEQCERAGFEVHTVDNCGVHYALTINKWFNNWMNNRDKVVGKYGEWWFRLWVVFLAWSTVIATQGCSTVFFVTLHKNRSAFDRKNTFVGDFPIAVQQ